MQTSCMYIQIILELHYNQKRIKQIGTPWIYILFIRILFIPMIRRPQVKTIWLIYRSQNNKINISYMPLAFQSKLKGLVIPSYLRRRKCQCINKERTYCVVRVNRTRHPLLDEAEQRRLLVRQTCEYLSSGVNFNRSWQQLELQAIYRLYQTTRCVNIAANCGPGVTKHCRSRG